MARKFQGFSKSAPKDLPVTKSGEEVEAGGGTAVATSAWSGDDVYNVHKFAVTFRENLEEVLTQVIEKQSEIVQAQQDVVDAQKKMIDKLAACERKDTTFFMTLIGLMIAFLAIYAFK
jgi:hypothetical protein